MRLKSGDKVLIHNGVHDREHRVPSMNSLIGTIQPISSYIIKGEIIMLQNFFKITIDDIDNRKYSNIIPIHKIIYLFDNLIANN